MKIIAKNCGLNGAYLVVECDKDDIEITLNKFSGFENKNYAPISVGICNWNNQVLILFKRTR